MIHSSVTAGLVEGEGKRESRAQLPYPWWDPPAFSGVAGRRSLRRHRQIARRPGEVEGLVLGRKKIIAFLRRLWKINPVTRVEELAMEFTRPPAPKRWQD